MIGSLVEFVHRPTRENIFMGSAKKVGLMKLCSYFCASSTAFSQRSLGLDKWIPAVDVGITYNTVMNDLLRKMFNKAVIFEFQAHYLVARNDCAQHIFLLHEQYEFLRHLQTEA